MVVAELGAASEPIVVAEWQGARRLRYQCEDLVARSRASPTQSEPASAKRKVRIFSQHMRRHMAQVS